MSLYVKRYISDDVDNSNYTSLFRFQSSSTGNDKGEVFSLISVTGKNGFLGDKAVKFVWDGLRDSYLLSNSGSVIEDIKFGLKAAVKKLGELLRNDKELESSGVELGISIIVVKGANAYLGRVGDQGIHIIKNNSLVDVGGILDKNRAGVASISFASTDYLALSTRYVLSDLPKHDSSESIIDILLSYGESLDVNKALVILSREKITETIEHDQEDPTIEDIVGLEEVPEVSEVPKVEIQVEEIEKSSVVNKNELVNVLKSGETYKNIFMQLKSVWKVVVKYMKLIVSYVEKALSKIGEVLSNIFMNIKVMLDKQFGRKIWYRKMQARFSFMSSNSSVQGMKIDGYREGQTRSKRIGILFGVIALALILFLFVRLAMNAQVARENHNYAIGIIKIVNEKIEEAQSSINFDKEAAEIALFDANETLATLEDRKYSIDDMKKLNDIKKNISELEDKLYSRVRLTEDSKNIELYIESITQFGDGSKPEDITIYKDSFQNEYIYITDSGLKSVYKIDLSNKELVKLPDANSILFSPKYIDVGVSGIFVYDSITGVVTSEMDKKTNHQSFKKLTGLEKDDIGNEDISELAILTLNDNVYLVSRSDTSILRSLKQPSGYGYLSPLFTDDILANGSDFFGDNVASYLVSENGTGLYRLNSVGGRLVNSNLVVSELKPEKAKFTAGYTGGSLDTGFYAFDSENKRIVHFEKPKETSGDILHPNELFTMKQYIWWK